MLAKFCRGWGYFVGSWQINYCKGESMKIAVVGATGLVGESLCDILARNMPNATLQLYGNKSVGKRVCYGAKWYTVLPTENILDSLPDVAMFMANESVAKQYVPQLSLIHI